MKAEDTPINEEIDAGIENEQIDGDEVITNPFDPTEIRVERETPTIDLLIKRIRHSEINLAPDFQRKGGIWNEGAQSRLIESILIRIPLPAFYVDATNEDEWLVVDGLQRMTTLRRFILDGELRLSGLEFLKNLDGKTFKELPRNLQRRIEETGITLFLIQPGTPPEVKFNIFKRINTGGLPLSTQEIRNAINGTRVREFILKLTESDAFKTATHGALSDKRMADRECVVRFIAFRLNSPKDYKGKDFDGFLNGVMGQLNDPNKIADEELTIISEDFVRAMKAATAIFQGQAFRKYYGADRRLSPINKALFESIACNLASLSEESIETLEKRSSALMNGLAALHGDNEFLASISQSTGSPSRISRRFKSIKTLFQKVVDDTLEKDELEVVER
jgi:hypothetical protein